MPRLSAEPVEMTHDIREWLQDEYRAMLARQRRDNCGFMDLLEIRIPEILCESCFSAKVDGIFTLYRAPDVLAETWESDLANILDEDEANSLAEDQDSPRCHSCRQNLHGAKLYVETQELSERLGVLDDTAAIKPSRKRKQEVLNFYGRRCFACGAGVSVEIDHIEPRSRGGTAAFQNLQPLCRKCGQAKGDSPPQHIVATFDPWPA